jgi:hypothetical protein
MGAHVSSNIFAYLDGLDFGFEGKRIDTNLFSTFQPLNLDSQRSKTIVIIATLLFLWLFSIFKREFDVSIHILNKRRHNNG